MTCPCCLPKCCPAYRAFDGSNTFYRYLTLYDWDLPVSGVSLVPGYVMQPEDNDPALRDGVPVPPGREVDGHSVRDAASCCSGYEMNTVQGDVVFRPPGDYGRIRWSIVCAAVLQGSIYGVNINSSGPTPYVPSRRKNVYNLGVARANVGTYEAAEFYAPASGDPLRSVAPYLPQKQGISLLRYELSGEYLSPPSPYCYMNSTTNPLP